MLDPVSRTSRKVLEWHKSLCIFSKNAFQAFSWNLDDIFLSVISEKCYKFGYCLKQHSILDIRRNRDTKLWRRISSTNTALSDLLPPQRTRQSRTRSHNYILPKVRTSRLKYVLIKRRSFNSNKYLFVVLFFFLLSCKLLHVCLHNEFLIKSFIMMMMMLMLKEQLFTASGS